MARRVLEVTTQLTANQKRMTELIQQSPAAPLLEMVGAGAVTVATVLTVVASRKGSQRSRLRLTGRGESLASLKR